VNSEHHRLATDLFERVRSLPKSERRAILDRECADNPDVRAFVARLLAETETTVEYSELPSVARDDPSASLRLPALLRPRQHFGDFRLQRLLGTGGFAQVWEAEHLDGRRVALKVLKQLSPSREAVERFEREGRLAASLNHPRSVYVFGAFEIEGQPTIAMELVPAGSLEDRLREHGALPPKEAVDRILEILEGLEAAHRLGIVHRDVKPSNCFIDADGGAKIGDYGISRSLELDTRLTATGSFLGTPAYASPEQLRGEDLDARADLYSVGATLYALLSGRPPFAAQNAGMLFSQILTERPRPFSERGVRVPRGLERAVLRLLEKDPNKRYRDCASVRAALVSFSSQGLTFAGIAGRPGVFVLDSLLPFGVLVLLSKMADLSSIDASRHPTLRSMGAEVLLNIVWFTTFETLWAGTPFKRLLGFRVTGPEGRRASFRSVFVRNVVFFVGIDSVGLVAVALGAGEASRNFLGLLGPVVVSWTMRKSNGFAGLHELASGTRVMRRRKPTGRREPELADGPRPLGEPPALETDGGRLGPYHLEGRIASCEDGELFLGRDDALGRPVWIRAHAARPTDHWDVNRAGRLRRLLRKEEEGRSWEAFEAPDGAGLARRVEARGTLSWEEMCRLLPTLVEELRTGCERGDLPERISLDHLWADASGQLRLLDFPLRDQRTGEASEDVASSDWGVLLHQLLLLGLEGRVVRLADLAGQLPRLPLPEHARELVARVCDRVGEPPSLAWLHDQLSESATKPARVTRSQRGMALAMSVLPVLFLALMVAFVMSHDAFQKGSFLFAWKFVLGLLYGVGSGIAIGVVPAIAMTFIFRGGPWMRHYGIRVQTADGQRASRLRCFLRGLIVYSPALLMVVPWIISVVVLLEQGHVPTPHPGTQGFLSREAHLIVYAGGWLMGAGDRWGITPMLPLTGAVFIAGAVQALVRPERGLADRVARTCLVPR